MSWSRRIFIVLAVVVVPLAEANAEAGKAAVRDPGDPKAVVPPVRYDSPFARYRANKEVEVGAWRDANDVVGRIGGWRVYGREAIPEAPADQRPSPGGRDVRVEPAKPEPGPSPRGPR